MTAENFTADLLQSKPANPVANQPNNLARAAKPYPEFPLTAHPTGRWCKKIRGRIHYFGPWDNPDAARAKYLEQKDHLHSGRVARPDPNALTIKELCNQFLKSKRARVDAGELTRLTWGDYNRACDEIIAAFGKSRLVSDLGPDEFAALRNRMARKRGRAD
jgi:hypothetical protein